MSTRVSRALLLGAVVGALVLAGCSGEEPDAAASGNASSASSASTSSPTGSAEEPETQGAGATGGEAAGIDLDNPPEAISSVTIPGEPKGDVVDSTVELVKLEKRGKVLLAVFRVTPNGTTEETSLFSAVRWTPTMVDLVNLKSYSAINELTTGYTHDLVMNEPNYVMAGFAIPENTDTIDIGPSPEGLRMEGVPLP